MLYNKNRFKKANDKKILHKIGKHWVALSIATLLAIGAGSVATVNVNASQEIGNNGIVATKDANVSHQALVGANNYSENATRYSAADSYINDANRYASLVASDSGDATKNVQSDFDAVNSVASTINNQKSTIDSVSSSLHHDGDNNDSSALNSDSNVANSATSAITGLTSSNSSNIVNLISFEVSSYTNVASYAASVTSSYADENNSADVFEDSNEDVVTQDVYKNVTSLSGNAVNILNNVLTVSNGVLSAFNNAQSLNNSYLHAHMTLPQNKADAENVAGTASTNASQAKEDASVSSYVSETNQADYDTASLSNSVNYVDGGYNVRLSYDASVANSAASQANTYKDLASFEASNATSAYHDASLYAVTVSNAADNSTASSNANNVDFAKSSVDSFSQAVANVVFKGNAAASVATSVENDAQSVANSLSRANQIASNADKIEAHTAQDVSGANYALTEASSALNNAASDSQAINNINNRFKVQYKDTSASNSFSSIVIAVSNDVQSASVNNSLTSDTVTNVNSNGELVSSDDALVDHYATLGDSSAASRATEYASSASVNVGSESNVANSYATQTSNAASAANNEFSQANSLMVSLHSSVVSSIANQVTLAQQVASDATSDEGDATHGAKSDADLATTTVTNVPNEDTQIKVDQSNANQYNNSSANSVLARDAASAEVASNDALGAYQSTKDAENNTQNQAQMAEQAALNASLAAASYNASTVTIDLASARSANANASQFSDVATIEVARVVNDSNQVSAMQSVADSTLASLFTSADNNNAASAIANASNDASQTNVIHSTISKIMNNVSDKASEIENINDNTLDKVLSAEANPSYSDNTSAKRRLNSTSSVINTVNAEIPFSQAQIHNDEVSAANFANVANTAYDSVKNDNNNPSSASYEASIASSADSVVQGLSVDANNVMNGVNYSSVHANSTVNMVNDVIKSISASAERHGANGFAASAANDASMAASDDGNDTEGIIFDSNHILNVRSMIIQQSLAITSLIGRSSSVANSASIEVANDVISANAASVNASSYAYKASVNASRAEKDAKYPVNTADASQAADVARISYLGASSAEISASSAWARVSEAETIMMGAYSKAVSDNDASIRATNTIQQNVQRTITDANDAITDANSNGVFSNFALNSGYSVTASQNDENIASMANAGTSYGNSSANARLNQDLAVVNSANAKASNDQKSASDESLVASNAINVASNAAASASNAFEIGTLKSASADLYAVNADSAASIANSASQAASSLVADGSAQASVAKFVDNDASEALISLATSSTNQINASGYASTANNLANYATQSGSAANSIVANVSDVPAKVSLTNNEIGSINQLINTRFNSNSAIVNRVNTLASSVNSDNQVVSNVETLANSYASEANVNALNASVDASEADQYAIDNNPSQANLASVAAVTESVAASNNYAKASQMASQISLATKSANSIKSIAQEIMNSVNADHVSVDASMTSQSAIIINQDRSVINSGSASVNSEVSAVNSFENVVYDFDNSSATSEINSYNDDAQNDNNIINYADQVINSFVQNVNSYQSVANSYVIEANADRRVGNYAGVSLTTENADEARAFVDNNYQHAVYENSMASSAANNAKYTYDAADGLKNGLFNQWLIPSGPSIITPMPSVPSTVPASSVAVMPSSNSDNNVTVPVSNVSTSDYVSNNVVNSNNDETYINNRKNNTQKPHKHSVVTGKSRKLNNVKIGNTINYHGKKLVRVAVPKQFRYFIINKNTPAYRTIANVGKHKGIVITLNSRQNLTLRINRIFTVRKHGTSLTYYGFKLKNRELWIDNRNTSNAYWQRSDVKKHSNVIRVVRGCRIYRSIHYSRKAAVKNVSKGMTLRIKHVISLGNRSNYQTRFELTGGNYITANKNFVELIK